MNRRTKLRWGLSLSFSILGGGVACGVITLPDVPVAPMNTCTDDPACSAAFGDAGAQATCSNGICSGATTSGFPTGGPFLVVSIPRNIEAIGGSTIPLPDNYAFLRTSLVPASCSAPDGVECDPLPPLASFVNGWLSIARTVDFLLWPPNGLRPNQNKVGDNADTTLPMHVVFRMLYTDPATNSPMLASKLGIPLDDVTGIYGREPPLFGPTNSPNAHVPGYSFSAYVPQPISASDPAGQYELEIIPDDPYDTFPPHFDNTLRVQLTTATLTPTVLDLANVYGNSASYLYVTPDTVADSGPPPPLVAHNYEVDELSGAPNLDGWIVHVDDSEGRRVSGNVKLRTGPTKNITVYEATGTKSQSLETLFIDPPSGVDLPRYFTVAVSGGSIFGPFQYPALPVPVSYSGFVLTSTDQQQASATVTFFANNGTPSPYLVEADGVTPAPLEYTKTITTTSKGEYALASLPPGVFRVYVVPDDPDLALTVIPAQTVSAGAGQSGKTLFVNHRTHVKGRVVLPDGTPVYAADVVIGPSADAPFLPADDPRARPREVAGKTDVTGHFDIASDPGAVDISVRPIEGSHFPWVVLTNRVVVPSEGADGGAASPLSLDITIPLPMQYTQSQPIGLLTDSLGNPVAHAVVRAYAFPELTTTGDAGVKTSRGARLIGMTTTDDTGLYQLFLAPPDPE